MINNSLDDTRRKFYDSKRPLPSNVGFGTVPRYLYYYCTEETLRKVESSKVIKSINKINVTERNEKDRGLLKDSLRELYLTDNGNLTSEGSRIVNALPVNTYPSWVIQIDYGAMLNEGLSYNLKRSVTGNLQKLGLIGIGGGAEYIFYGNKEIPMRFFRTSKNLLNNSIKHYSIYFNKEDSIDNVKNKFYDSNYYSLRNSFKHVETVKTDQNVDNRIVGYSWNKLIRIAGTFSGLVIIASSPSYEDIMASYYFIKNYSEMRTANTKKSDKYFHCKANWEASRMGWRAEYMATRISNFREVFDQKIKGDSRLDSEADQEANYYGRKQVENNSITNGKDACRKYRPNGLSEEY